MNALSGVSGAFRHHGAGAGPGQHGCEFGGRQAERFAAAVAAQQSHRRLRVDRARRLDPCAAALRHRQRHGGQPRGGGQRRGGRLDAVRHAAAFQEGHRPGAAARAADRAAVRTFRHTVARHRAYHAGRARRLHHRLAQCARRFGRGRALRLRRIYRPHRALSRDDGAGRASGGGVPALRRRAGGGGGDGAGRQSGAAALDDADGRPDRHPRQPDQGQRSRQKQADGVVREEPDRNRAPPLCRRRTARLSRLRAARRLHEHEYRASFEGASGTVRESGARRGGQGRRYQGVLRRIFRRARSHCRVLSGNREAGIPGTRAAARRAHLQGSKSRTGGDPAHHVVHRGRREGRHLRGWPNVGRARPLHVAQALP